MEYSIPDKKHFCEEYIKLNHNDWSFKSIPEHMDKLCFKTPTFDTIKNHLITQVLAKFNNGNLKPKKFNSYTKKEDGNDITYNTYMLEDHSLKGGVFYTLILGNKDGENINQTLHISMRVLHPTVYYNFYFHISKNKILFNYGFETSDNNFHKEIYPVLKFELASCDDSSEVCKFIFKQNMEHMPEFEKIIHTYGPIKDIFDIAFSSVNFVLNRFKF